MAAKTPPRKPKAIDFDVEDGSLTKAQRTQIINLFLKRVRDPAMRQMIIRYATFLAESRDNDVFYSGLYTFSKAENFDKLRQAYKDFAIDAQDLSEYDADFAEDLAKRYQDDFGVTPDKKPAPKKKK